MLGKLVTILVVLAAFAALPLAGADAQQGTYASPALGYCPVACLSGSVAGNNLGSVTFPANGLPPASVQVFDASGLPVSFSVCQAQPASGVEQCDTPSVDGCGVTDLAGVGFTGGEDTIVFINAISPDCSTPATSGTILVDY